MTTQQIIALDVGSVRDEPAGVGSYAASLAAGLAEIAPDAVALIGVRSEAGRLASIDRGVRRLPFRGANYHGWIQLHAANDARRAGASLIHFTNAAAPLVTRLPYVLTVHDLSVMMMPRAHPVPRLATLPVTIAAIARATAIVVPSRFTGRELTQRLRVSPRRLAVIEHAPLMELPDAPAGGHDLLRRLAVEPGRYLLSVGTLEPRKNVERIVAAFEQVGAEDAGLRLVLAGAPGWHYCPILDRIENSLLRSRIVLAGYVAPADLAALIRSSAVVCYPSLYEGYGMPVLEAMALGAAVVTSDQTAMPEAAGGAGVLVNPLDVDDVARGIRHAIANRSELVAAGLRRAAGRTWVDVAREHMAVYRWAGRR